MLSRLLHKGPGGVASHMRCKSGREQGPHGSVYAAAVTVSVYSFGTSPAVVGLKS